MSLETEFHSALEARAREWLILEGTRPLTNYRLPNGRIADLIGITNTKLIIIIEIKTDICDSLIDQAISKYYPYCHKLYIGAPINEARKVVEKKLLHGWPNARDYVGVLSIGDRAVEVLRAPLYHKLREPSNTYINWHINQKLDIDKNGSENLTVWAPTNG